MVTEDPLNAGSDTVLLLVRSLVEVPDNSGSRDDELRDANDERSEPECTENVINDDRLGILVPHNLCGER